ncbi:MAG: hypothetical protein B6D37_14005 [Sphingobacteriales bacterium UTBCD1]|nr:MAG: hypothetical protein B6D37_14005 [Sphingobacteriales bacterium UTBCD1]
MIIEFFLWKKRDKKNTRSVESCVSPGPEAFGKNLLRYFISFSFLSFQNIFYFSSFVRKSTTHPTTFAD